MIIRLLTEAVTIPTLFRSPGLVLWDCALVGKVAAPTRAWSPLAPGLPALVEQPHSRCSLTVYEVQSQLMERIFLCRTKLCILSLPNVSFANSILSKPGSKGKA